MYQKITFRYLITSLLIVFMFSCGGGGGINRVADSCESDPKWYSNEDCPRGHLCGFGSNGSGNKSSAEFSSKSLARNDLAASVKQKVIRELTGSFMESEGTVPEPYEKLFMEDKFTTQVKREVTSSIVDQKENTVCDGKNWYWVSVKKDIDGINFEKLFENSAAELSESDQAFINDTKSWAAKQLED